MYSDKNREQFLECLAFFFFQLYMLIDNELHRIMQILIQRLKRYLMQNRKKNEIQPFF